jgi:hypothetical protein
MVRSEPVWGRFRMSDRAFCFQVGEHIRPWSRLFLVHPETCSARIEHDQLSVMFGRWSLTTPLTNIADVTVTGPYTWWKVAGPAHLSLKDRGVTFATTDERGVCVSFVEPVAAIEPSGVITHPSLTLTVADVDGFVDALNEARSSQSDTSSAAPQSAPVEGLQRAGLLSSVSSLVSWLRRSDHEVVHQRRLVDRIDVPELWRSESDDEQSIDEGVGPAFHRQYRVRIGDTDVSATDAISRLRQDLERAVDGRLAPVTKLDGEIGELSTGDRYLLGLAGPWSAPVTVTASDDTSFRFGTLHGHLEAGVIEFRVEPDEGGLSFVIESWARSGDQAMWLLYDVLGIARVLQAELWVRMCEQFVHVAGGRQIGPVQIITERTRS